VGVPAASPFSRVLDEKLSAAATAQSLSGAAPAGANVPPQQPAPLWLLDSDRCGPRGHGTGRASARAYACSAAAPSGRSSTQPHRAAARGSDRPRVKRVSVATAEQKQALARLRTLGAVELSSELVEADLKHAFRSIARRLHPDARPDLSIEARRQCEAQFAEAADAYRILLAASRG
jgi:hypothetical protein